MAALAEKRELERGRREYERWKREHKEESTKDDEYRDRKGEIEHLYYRVARAQRRGEHMNLRDLIKDEDRWILERIMQEEEKSAKSRHADTNNFSNNDLNATVVDTDALTKNTLKQLKKYGPEGKKFVKRSLGRRWSFPDNKNVRRNRIRTMGWSKDFKKMKPKKGQIGGRRKRTKKKTRRRRTKRRGRKRRVKRRKSRKSRR